MIKEFKVYSGIKQNIELYHFNKEVYPNLLKQQNLYRSVHEYTVDDHRIVNFYLRNPERLITLKAQKEIDDIDIAIDYYYQSLLEHGLTDIIKPFHVNRKFIPTSKELELILDMVKTGTYRDLGYMSTSTGDKFGSSGIVTLDIEVTSLNIGAFLYGLSIREDEREFLIKRGLSFDVLDYSIKGDKYLIKLRNK